MTPIQPQSWIDEQLWRIYRSGTLPAGTLTRLAKRTGVSRQTLRKRALQIGAAFPKKKEPPWSERELDILEKNYGRHLDCIVSILRREGYHRTDSAVANKRKRLGLYQRGSNVYNVEELGRCFGVTGQVVKRWIDKGHLVATKRPSKRTPAQRGEYWDILEPDIRRFVYRNVVLIDFCKLDKFWLMDLLENRNKSNIDKLVKR